MKNAGERPAQDPPDCLNSACLKRSYTAPPLGLQRGNPVSFCNYAINRVRGKSKTRALRPTFRTISRLYPEGACQHGRSKPPRVHHNRHVLHSSKDHAPIASISSPSMRPPLLAPPIPPKRGGIFHWGGKILGTPGFSSQRGRGSTRDEKILFPPGDAQVAQAPYAAGVLALRVDRGGQSLRRT